MTKQEAVEILKIIKSDFELKADKVLKREALAVAIREFGRQYTREPPTVPGGYWWKGDDPCEIEENWAECVRDVFQNWEGELMTYVKSHPCRVEGIGGLWCGPLTPPE